jgi:hypothetical protein
MKKKSILTVIVAFAMTSLCCLFTACSDDDNNEPTPQKTITSGTFYYLFAFNKDILQWSDLSLTLTPSKGTALTTSLNDSLNRKLDEMQEYEQYFLNPSTMLLPGRLHDYVFYSVPLQVNEFPMTINVKLNWKVKEGYQVNVNDRYNVTLVEAYGVGTNTNQNFASYQNAFKYSGIQGQHLAEFVQGRSNSDVILTLAVENGKVEVKRNDKE